MTREEIGSGVLRAAMAMLRPLVRQMLVSGVLFGRFEKEARALFVTVAERDFPIPDDRPQTDSRLALLTGINRKEVHRIRGQDARESAPRSFSRDLAANLVSVWMRDPRATDRAGRPIPIPYQDARRPSFVRFARRTTRDLRPRAFLDALVGSGAAELRPGGLVALRADFYVPRRGEPEQLAMLAEDPPELIATMLHNVLGDGPDLRLQRKVVYDNLGRDGMARLREALRREGERFARRANAILARHDRDRNPKAPAGERTYAGVGVYYFESPAPPASRGAANPARARRR